MLAALGYNVLISDCANHEILINYLKDYKISRLGLVIGVRKLRDIILEKYTTKRAIYSVEQDSDTANGNFTRSGTKKTPEMSKKEFFPPRPSANPAIYAYELVGVATHQGLIKIGYCLK